MVCCGALWWKVVATVLDHTAVLALLVTNGSHRGWVVGFLSAVCRGLYQVGQEEHHCRWFIVEIDASHGGLGTVV